jgi:hypothetical protein
MRIHSRVLQFPLAARRRGIMIHYDDSSRDDWALEWFHDPRCKNGYTWLALDDGGLVELADPALRTPHAGPCLVPRANSVFYGISAATNGLVPATPAQFDTIVRTCVALFHYHGWSALQVADRIVGHDAQAVWTPEYTRAAGIPESRARLLWGTLGRKVDPTGVRPDHRKIIDVSALQTKVALLLRAYGHPDEWNHRRPEEPFCHPEERSDEGSAFCCHPEEQSDEGSAFHVRKEVAHVVA